MTPSSAAGERHIGTFWLLNLAGPLPAGVPPRVPTVFTRTGAEVAHELAQAMGLDDVAVVLQRFATGRQCYIGRVEGRLATYGWVTFDQEHIGELGLSIRLKPGEVYIWDCATLPAYRGQLLFPALLAYMLGQLRNQGVSRAWIGADSDNLSSQKGFILAGFRPIADIVLDDTHQVWMRNQPGAATQEIADIRQALFDRHNPSWLLELRPPS